MVDNLYGYGPGVGPISEESPEAATDSKGRVRRELTEMLLDAHRSGQLKVTIGRASDYFGPRADNSTITALALGPVADGKPIRWVGRLDAPHSCAYLPDVARAYVTLGTSARADGEIWILPHTQAITGGQFLELVNATLPAPAKTGVVSWLMLWLAAPFHKISKEMLEILYQWTDPFVVDDSKFLEVFGPFERTPLDEAVRTAVAWYRSHDPALAT
jgi:nucleoside-diphosphate-sugar epimerase